MTKILVPVDFSDTATNALHYAIQLFDKESLEITLLHTYGEPSSGALIMKNIDGVLLKDSKEKMGSYLGGLQKQFPKVVFRDVLIKGNAASTIVKYAEEGNYGFIVMGTTGASGLKEVFMGSVAGGVVSSTALPVIIVPDKHHFRKLEDIVLAVSEKPFSTVEVVDPLRKIIDLNQSKLKILHIAQGKTPELEKVLTTLDDLNPTVQFAFGTGDTNEDLTDYLLKDYSGLLCLVRENKGFFERLLDGSVTLKQTFNSLVPLLILQD